MPSIQFPPEVADKLKTYVYRLIDPRNGETFYVGKGKGNRVFAHAAADVPDDAEEAKLKRIHQIRSRGFQVGHVIHRHGLDDRTAYEVEAALIDCYPGLTNIAGGYGSNDFGVMHADEIMLRYAALEAELRHRVLFINVNRSALEDSLYEAVRYAWKLDPKRARQAEFVLAVQQGLIVGAFVATHWAEATQVDFPTREPVMGRWGFVGQDAPTEIKRLYVGRRIPDRFRKRGASNPIKYSWTRS